jgi:hypothetical protein
MNLFPGGIQGDRTILHGKELDIYIPDKKLAIEFNGTYWHSTVYKDKNYHQEKSLECLKQGVQLIHIFEYEWINSDTKGKIISLLQHRLGSSEETVFGRFITIKEIDSDDCAEFLEKYHLQGATPSQIKIGAFYNNELIGVMTFGTPRFNSNYEYELIRLAWKSGLKAVGGTEKLFNYFIENYKPTSIISYCNLAKFSGEVYQRLGFKLDGTGLTVPNYVWVNSVNNDVLTRYQTQKQKLIDSGLGDLGNTEDEIMENLGYFKIYDAGNLKFIWKQN